MSSAEKRAAERASDQSLRDILKRVLIPKVRGTAARRADRLARRLAKEAKA